jgi:hypothetical protein
MVKYGLVLKTLSQEMQWCNWNLIWMSSLRFIDFFGFETCYMGVMSSIYLHMYACNSYSLSSGESTIRNLL